MMNWVIQRQEITQPQGAIIDITCSCINITSLSAQKQYNMKTHCDGVFSVLSVEMNPIGHHPGEQKGDARDHETRNAEAPDSRHITSVCECEARQAQEQKRTGKPGPERGKKDPWSATYQYSNSPIRHHPSHHHYSIPSTNWDVKA